MDFIHNNRPIVKPLRQQLRRREWTLISVQSYQQNSKHDHLKKE